MADKNVKEAPAAEAPEQEGEGKKGGNTLLVIGIIAGIVIVQVGLAYLLVPKPVDEEAKAAKLLDDSLRVAVERQTRVGAFAEDMPIEVTVNIAGTGGERFLKAVAVLEYEEKNNALGAELRRRPIQFKDLIQGHLSTLTLMEVTEAGAQGKIRKDLLRMINATLPAKMGEVQNVRFTTFIIQ